MRYDSIIFDLDGTLWDTCEGCAITWNQVLQEQKVDYREITIKDMATIMGKTPDEIRTLFFPYMEAEKANRLLHQILQAENAVIQQGGWNLYQGVREGLAKLAQHYPLYIVSNCQDGYIQTFDICTNLVQATIKDFEYIGRTGQPKGQNIRAIIDRNNLQNSIYIGDTAGDYAAAKQAGVDFAFAAYGFGNVPTPPRQFNNFTEAVDFFMK
ncbi:MAG: HAD-IA family hydrolase [Bdellovibrionota bacterium]